ncbi:MAG TPA: hypothetical protein DCM59_06915 [Clostridium sp.]|nr:hypothetical protein [Clostridium sp.]
MENTITKSKSIKIKNILGIAKYTFRTLRIMYLIEAVIIVLALGSSSFLSKYTLGLDLIPAISILLTMNFISHMIIFSMQLSKEYGRLLFLTPISGIDFILGNLLELVLVNLFIVMILNLGVIVNSGSVSSIVFFLSLSVSVGTTIAYLIITALIAILGSYIRSTSLCVLAVIGACIVGDIIYSFIANIILHFLPYVYMTIGKYGSIEIDIFSVLIDTLAIIILQLVAANIIDKKLDIV